MLKKPLEQVIIHALSKPHADPLVKECVALLNEYKIIEAPHDESIRFYDAMSGISLYFDEQDRLIKVELEASVSNHSVVEALVQKYSTRQKIYQQLAEPKIVQQTLLVYDLHTYWMRFELQEDCMQKMVYLALSTIGKNYRNKGVILRTCKSSGKR